MKYRLLAISTIVAAVSLYPSKASAELLKFFSKANFDAALATYGLVTTGTSNFDSMTAGVPLGLTLVDSSTGITFTLSGGTGNILQVNSGVTTSPSNFLGTDDPLALNDFSGSDIITFTLPNNTRAIGMNIVIDGIVQDPTVNTSLNVGTQFANTSEANQLSTILSGAIRSYFVGIIGTTPGDSFTTATINSTTAGQFFRLDNVQIAAIPEPTSVLLLGVASLLCLRRRHRNSLA